MGVKHGFALWCHRLMVEPYSSHSHLLQHNKVLLVKNFPVICSCKGAYSTITLHSKLFLGSEAIDQNVILCDRYYSTNKCLIRKLECEDAFPIGVHFFALVTSYTQKIFISQFILSSMPSCDQINIQGHM